MPLPPPLLGAALVVLVVGIALAFVFLPLAFSGEAQTDSDSGDSVFSFSPVPPGSDERGLPIRLDGTGSAVAGVGSRRGPHQ